MIINDFSVILKEEMMSINFQTCQYIICIVLVICKDTRKEIAVPS